MFFEFLREVICLEDFSIDRITREHVEAYQRERIGSGSSRATVNAHHLRPSETESFLWRETRGANFTALHP